MAVTRPLLAAVLLICSLPALAAAQPVPIAPPYGSQSTQDPQKQQLPLRAPLTLLPSVTISEEYNDNILLNNHDRRWDFITGVTPALNVILESRTFRLSAGYNFTAEFYARDSTNNSAFNHQNFTADMWWRATERLTLTVNDTFNATTDTNLIAPEGVSTGRDRSWGNNLAFGASYRLDERTSVRGGASYGLQRYNSEDLHDSDVYRADVGIDRTLTRQLTGSLGYQFGYFDIQREDKVTTHTPRVGFSWQITPTITVAASGGPSFEMRQDGADRITPAITASYNQRMWFGGISLAFNREIGTAGGLGGTTDNTSVGGTVDVTTLMRGLTVSFGPRYNWVKSADNNRIDISSFSVPLQVTYRITAWMAAVARYQFYRQRTDSEVRDSAGNLIAADADQNRLFVGLQFGYPITFDRP